MESGTDNLLIRYSSLLIGREPTVGILISYNHVGKEVLQFSHEMGLGRANNGLISLKKNNNSCSL